MKICILLPSFGDKPPNGRSYELRYENLQYLEGS